MVDTPQRANRLLANLSRRQAVVLLLLLSMGLMAYRTLDWTASFLFDDTALINIAGRQRMLSHRITAFSLELAMAKPDQDTGPIRDQLRQLARRMEDGHIHLLHDTEQRGMSAELRELYFGEPAQLDQTIGRFVEITRQLAELPDGEALRSSPLLEQLREMGRVTLLPQLEKVVGQYQDEGRTRVNRLRRYTEIGLYLLIAVLAFSWLGVFTPMSRRLRHELSARQASQERLELILGTVEEGIIGIGLDGRMTFANRAAENMLGYRPGELIGQLSHPLMHHSHPDGSPYPPQECPLHRTLREQTSCIASNEWFWRKDGTGFPIHFGSIPIIRDGEMLGAVLTFRDVTSERETERLLEASLQVRSSILDAALDAIVSIDSRGRIVEFNPAAERIFGHSLASVRGRDIAEIIIPEELREAHHAGMARISAGTPSRLLGSRIELVGQHADGHRLPVELTITHLADHGLFTAFIRDLTEQKQTESALRRSQKLEAVGQLTGGIAHDFNNLLGIITGNLELLQTSVTGNDKAAKRVATALSSAKRGADLTRRLLAFSRQDPAAHGKSQVNVNDVVSGMLEMLQRSLTQKIQIDARLADQPWPCEINRSEFEDSLLNLVLNARDAMPDGGRIDISTENRVIDANNVKIDPHLTEGDYVVVSISDTGHGIPKEIADRIFEPFFTTKERGKGTGLGLSMVYGFAKRSGGHVRAYSEEGHGTTFRLYLPSATSVMEAPVNIPDDDALPTGNETILVLDDEPHLVEIAGDLLEGQGYTTIRCTDPSQALTLIAERPDIDLVFTDVMMPHGVDGYAIARQAAKFGLAGRVILTSGFTGHIKPGDAALDQPQIITKPYAKKDLIRLVRQVLDGNKKGQK